MAPSRKGLYTFCENCIFKLETKIKYPCSQSHKNVRKSDNVKLERDFKICRLKKII